MSTALTGFAKHLQELRKERGWSQPELAQKIGTSGAIIGRYERGEMTPSIEVAKKLADTFSVTLDYLVADDDTPDVLKDKDMLARWQAINALDANERERILYVVDSLLRDTRARQAYRTVR